uniref:Uncharacterized protein n=1 Tax=Chromera velia CCMP2878 TaxID=1169474 RepID=A0A0G4HTW1_9ALVE|eukprot:Cvel_31501.t1-p1 / transcript=Cvel_31501.t1 / gene=Cvel_31501 / organism=Chromera_velia_CCMP2878 / gene_product=hypothetical protein / transcript_product=hypothetical protein / location=Cvel_scaffold4703:3747-4434(-) / protein_length=112 / sequence_SO=supercontig / SO=protein_coding / is_pseudo=false
MYNQGEDPTHCAGRLSEETLPLCASSRRESQSAFEPREVVHYRAAPGDVTPMESRAIYSEILRENQRRAWTVDRWRQSALAFALQNRMRSTCSCQVHSKEAWKRKKNVLVPA